MAPAVCDRSRGVLRGGDLSRRARYERGLASMPTRECARTVWGRAGLYAAGKHRESVYGWAYPGGAATIGQARCSVTATGAMWPRNHRARSMTAPMLPASIRTDTSSSTAEVWTDRMDAKGGVI